MLDDVKKYYIYRSLNKRLAMPVWFLIMIDSGLSIQYISLIIVISTIISFLLEIPSGSVADTIGHKRALIFAAIGQGVGLALFIGGGFWWILAGSIAYFATGSLMTGTHEAFFFEKLMELGRKNEYQKLMGRARSVSAFFSAFVVSTAGFLYLVDPRLPFLASAIIFWLGAAVVSSMKANQNEISVKEKEGFEAWLSHFGTSWETITKNSALLWLILINSMIMGSFFAVTELQQIILDNIGLAVGLFGILYTVKRLFTGVTALLLHRLSPYLSPTRTITLMFSMITLYLILISQVTNHVAIFFVVLLASGTIVINDVLISHYKNALIPIGSRATTLSMGNFAQDITKLTLIAFVAFVTMRVSIENAHLILGFIFIGLGFILLPRLYKAFEKQNPASI
jgi:MFS family permease